MEDSKLQVCLTHLHQTCLVTCEWEVCMLEVRHVCMLALFWTSLEMLCIVGFAFLSLCKMTRHHFLGTQEWAWPESIILAGI